MPPFSRQIKPIFLILGGLALSIAGVRAAPPGQPPRVFFGQHLLYNQTFQGLPPGLFDGLRIWGAEGSTWAEIEKRQGVYDFRLLDLHVAAAEARKLSLMHTLGQTPRWASARPDEKGNTGMGAAAEPADLKDWARYVREIATRYRGRISAYEVMNEPRIPEAVKPWSPGFFSGSAATLAEMTRIAAFEVKKADPHAKIVCPAMDGAAGLRRLDHFLGIGGGKHCDVIGFHYYLEHHSIDELKYLIRETRRIQEHHGYAHLPIWNTETGLLIADAGYGLQPRHTSGPLGKMFGSAEAIRLAARMLVVSTMLGVERTYWFAHDSSWMGSTLPDKRLNQLNAFGKSLAVLKTWLGGRTLRNCRDTGSEVLCEVVDGQRKAGAIYWGRGKAVAEWRESGYTQAETLAGRSLILGQLEPAAVFPSIADEPVFLH